VLSRAPLAIVSPGSTLLECAAMGVPALAVSHNEREARRAKRMLAEGHRWFRYIGSTAEAAERIRSEVERLMGDPHAMAAMSAAGRKAVDGCGAWRVGAIVRRKIAALHPPPPPPGGERASANGTRPLRGRA